LGRLQKISKTAFAKQNREREEFRFIKRSRLFVGPTIAILALSLLPAHQVLAQAMGGGSITGNYRLQVTGTVFGNGVANITQQGSRVVGTAPAPGGTVNFSGTLQNNKLSGTWRSPKNETGWLTFWFNQNARGFEGEFGYHGREPDGSVVGTRTR
jgi:hypothetical protein